MSADLSYGFASRHGVLLQEPSRVLCRSDVNLEVLLELQRYLQQPFELQEVASDEFTRRLTQHYQRSDAAAQQAVDDLGAEFDLTSLVDDIQEDGDLLAEDDDAPVIRLINAVLSQAVREKASDVHIEPFEDRVAIRFRVDGLLSEILSPKSALAAILVSRLKIMARLDIAEKRLPQDGRITVKLAGHAVDIRMSTIPSVHGERVVLRLLDKSAGQMTLSQLSMPEPVREAFSQALHRSHGIILVTGPTGSGKTTSLYAGLTHIGDRQRNILTIEDPVEYLVSGIGQTQVNNKVDMTFAKGLRAILRQDPDVVMVGEIRDRETAATAVQASLTGHLVLSSLHTNTAIGAVIRLQDMGVEPFLLSSSLCAIMAQRLVRVLCEHCKCEHRATQAEARLLEVEEASLIYRAGACDHCKASGYSGRMGIYELIVVDETLRQLIHEGAGEQALTEYVRTKSESIAADGRRRVLSGLTTLEEVLRVTAVS